MIAGGIQREIAVNWSKAFGHKVKLLSDVIAAIAGAVYQPTATGPLRAVTGRGSLLCDRVQGRAATALGRYRMRILQKTVATLGLGTLLASTPAWAQGAPAETSAPAEGAAVSTEEVARNPFDRDLLTVEEQVHGLKEQVFRSKATLQLLKEIVVQGASSGARASIVHVNKLGKAYAIEAVSYFLDGQGKYSKVDADGDLSSSKEFKVFDGNLPPGNHAISVSLRLRGNGYGLFSYVKDYTFNVKANTTVVVDEGRNCQVKVISDERKGVGRSFTERPNVTFETRCTLLADNATSPEL